MTAKCFVDTNIFVYSRDAHDKRKTKIAANLIYQLGTEGTGRISYQVLSEYTYVLLKKFQVNDDLIEADINNLLSWNPVPVDEHLIKLSFQLYRHYKLSWWDCNILAAAVLQECKYLLSEDLADGAFYHNLKVVNPFSEKFRIKDL